MEFMGFKRLEYEGMRFSKSLRGIVSAVAVQKDKGIEGMKD